MKIVGQFNNKPIALESLFITQTYLGYLGIIPENYPEINKGILEKTIPELVEEHFGKNSKFITLGTTNFDLANPLPSETAIASLIGASPAHKGDFSFLTIAWLQEPDPDIYKMVEEAVKNVDWINEAEDGEW